MKTLFLGLLIGLIMAPAVCAECINVNGAEYCRNDAAQIHTGVQTPAIPQQYAPTYVPVPVYVPQQVQVYPTYPVYGYPYGYPVRLGVGIRIGGHGRWR